MVFEKISEKIKWDKKLCKDCNICVLMCPLKTIELKDGKLVEFGKCGKCGICENFCPDFAIEVIKDEKADARK